MRAHGGAAASASLQRLRGEDREAEAFGLARDRARPQLHAAPGGLRRPRIDRDDLMAAADDLKRASAPRNPACP